jgi:hypothetical protein
VAFVSVHAVRGEIKAGHLFAVRIKGFRLRRHFHVIHNEARLLTHSARALVEALGGARGETGRKAVRGQRVASPAGRTL